MKLDRLTFGHAVKEFEFIQRFQSRQPAIHVNSRRTRCRRSPVWCTRAHRRVTAGRLYVALWSAGKPRGLEKHSRVKSFRSTVVDTAGCAGALLAPACVRGNGTQSALRARSLWHIRPSFSILAPACDQAKTSRLVVTQSLDTHEPGLPAPDAATRDSGLMLVAISLPSRKSMSNVNRVSFCNSFRPAASTASLCTKMSLASFTPGPASRLMKPKRFCSSYHNTDPFTSVAVITPSPAPRPVRAPLAAPRAPGFDARPPRPPRSAPRPPLTPRPPTGATPGSGSGAGEGVAGAASPSVAPASEAGAVGCGTACGSTPFVCLFLACSATGGPAATGATAAVAEGFPHAVFGAGGWPPAAGPSDGNSPTTSNIGADSFSCATDGPARALLSFLPCAAGSRATGFDAALAVSALVGGADCPAGALPAPAVAGREPAALRASLSRLVC